MSLIRWTPLYEPFLDVERAFNGLAIGSVTTPAVDLYDTADSVVAEVALTGFDPENVKIQIENNILSIEGTSEKKSEVDDKNYYRKELQSGSFHRVISLPAAVNGQETTAEYDKGILRITMPKKEEVKPKAVSISIKK